MEDSPVRAVVAPMRIGCCASAAEEPHKPKPRQRIANQESLTQSIKSSRTPESATTIRHSNARQGSSNGSEGTFSTGERMSIRRQEAIFWAALGRGLISAQPQPD